MEPKEFYNRIDKYFERKADKRPVHSNRASQIGHPCLRYLVYDRTAWDKAIPMNTYSYMIFGEGNDQEASVTQWLEQLGYRAFLQNMSFPQNELNLTGHIDGVLSDPESGEEAPFDIKTCDSNLFPQIKTREDFQRKHWMVKWEYQMQAYMYLMKDYPKFWILLKNKTAKEVRVIEIPKDEKKFAEIERKCLLINGYVRDLQDEKIKIKKYPDRVVSLDYCNRCQYRHLCLPPLKQEAAEFIDDPEFVGLLERREELQSAHKEYDKLDKTIKATIKQAEGDKFICGEGDITFAIEKKEVKNPGYTVEPFKYEKVEILRIDSSPKLEED